MPDIHWRWTEGSTAITTRTPQILSDALHSEEALNSQRGTKVVVTGRIQTGSYTNKDGVKVYTTDVVVEDQEFAESKNAAASNDGGYSAPVSRPEPSAPGDGFMNIPDGIDEELPFN